MDYEKKYEEALERARNELKQDLHESGIGAIKRIFPELRESEDERIRKNRIHFLELQKGHHADTSEIDNCISWLKVRGEFNIERIKRSWYMQGYHDGEDNREPKWIITAREGGPRYEDNPRYGESLEQKQELCESEDEKIRKAIMVYIDWLDGKKDCQPKGAYSIRDMLAWLEKQKENAEKEYIFRPLAGTDITIAAEQAIKMSNIGGRLILAFNGAYIPVGRYSSAKEVVDEYNSYLERQKLVPRFRVGDILKKKGKEYTFTVDKIQDEFYLTAGGAFFPIDQQDEWELVEQKPVPHQVQVCEETELTDFENALFTAFSYAWQDYLSGKEVNVVEWVKEESPELLAVALQKQEWSANNKAFIKDCAHILDKNGYTASAERLLSMVEQKPAEWDEDTKINLDRALQIIKKAKGTLQGYQSDDGIYECDKAIECLEHFLYRGLEIEKAAEWSEEDELMRTAILNTLDRVGDYGTIGMQKDWLKSLRAQPHWKPSEEQMNALEHVLEMVEEEWGYEEIEVRSLIADLKKLMED